MNNKKCADLWRKIVSIYKETCETNPNTTMNRIIEEIGLEDTKEVFATVTAIKKHDGRIYGANREYMNSIPVDPNNIVLNMNNRMVYAGIDDIHTAHINQLITELRRINI